MSHGLNSSLKTVSDVRKEFLGFFETNGHQIVSSSPLVPQNDPTVMFTMAGMMQFKDIFTGKEQRDYSRATTSQKCVRAGGKHNDLDNVGYTARHHTFFEMLGNFSFGDYFKEEAISYAWELITKNFGVDENKLLITVHSSDEDAAALWRKIAGLSDDRIIRIPTSDNFWSMGDTGPCGPCTEIFYDHGDHIPGGPPGSPDEDGDRFIEIWNLVFMQFEQMADGSRVDLPAPSVDTGMGLERIAALLQGQHDNYDIDLFKRIIEQSASLTGVAATGAQAASHRVIADHLRCSAFLLADGVMPSNEGRGYVLRRIMRRGMRHAHLLGAQDPLMYKMVPTLVNLMGEAFPELRRAESLITQTLETEEGRFKKTLDHGLKLLEDESQKLSSGQKLDGAVAFKLYDTFGFPLDLTQDALRERDVAVDVDGFNICMEKQRETARKSWSGSGGSATEKIWYDLLDAHGATEFLGYKSESAEGQILAIVHDGAVCETIKTGDEAFLILNQTPFYGESGGQAGDCGVIKTASGAVFTVTDTKKQIGKLWVHVGRLESGTLKQNDGVILSVDHTRRSAIRANHSATHLMHEALRVVVGDHVSQKGSLQDAERTRFDISQPVALTPAQLAEVETIVNNEIRANSPVETRLMAIEDAMNSGAMALFGEKYDDEVRVVSMGSQKEGDNKAFSVELCGGTHVARTGDIGLLKIVGESAVSSGVRRIEALTGQNALAYLEAQEALVKEAAALLKAPAHDVLERLKSIIDERKALSNEVSELRRKVATMDEGGASENSNSTKDVGGIAFTAKVLAGFPPKDLKPMADALKSKIGSGVITLIATNEGKASIVVCVSDDLTAKINAVDLVKIGAEKLGGKGGGGRPDMAQAGGPDVDAANDAVTAIETAIGS